MAETIIGRCKYCGAEQTVIAKNQEEADRQVAQACDCNGVDLERKKEQLHFILDRLAGELATEEGFDAVNPEIYPVIVGVGDAVVEGKFASASIKIDGTIIGFSRNAKGRVQATRKVVINKGGAIE